MPYTVDSANLPSNVKKMSDKEKRQWVAIFNSSIESGKDEGYAFAAANGVVGKKELPTTWYDLPISDDVLTVTPPVGEISRSNNIFRAVLEGMKSLINPPAIVADIKEDLDDGKLVGNESFYVVKDDTGRLRWFAAVSNNFKDRQSEIITEEAHKEYIAWADKNLTYGELWLWHAGPGSKWGTCDWLDYCDGFQLSSGLVDEGKEFIAYNICKEDLGVSHGFLSLKDNGVITRYRRFETSPLPKIAAANEWTGFAVDSAGHIEVKDMPLSPEKKKFLVDAGHSEKQVNAIEAAYSTFAQSLKQNGVDYKAFEPIGGAKAMTDLIHHPHISMIDHQHAHADGTMHSHDHHHGDGYAGHDGYGHEASMHIGVGGSGKKEVTNAHKTKPAQYADVPDDKFLDSENWKYPADEKHLHAALAYYNHEGQKEAGGYSDAKWSAMGRKLAGLLGSGYSYSNGRVINSNKAMDDNDEDDKPSNDKKKKADDNDADDASSKEIAALGVAVKSLADQVTHLVAVVGAISAKQEEVSKAVIKSDDDKIADHFLASVAPFKVGHRPTQSKENVVDQLDPKTSLSWFKDMTIGDMSNTNGGRG